MHRKEVKRMVIINAKINTCDGGKIIERLLDTGYHVIVRPHPQSFTSEKEMIESLMERYPASEQLEWNRDADNFDVLNRSSILISDFSGVIFDFALVYDKPVIYADTSFDYGIYDQWWLNRPYWTFDILPSLGKQLTPEKLDELKNMIDGSQQMLSIDDVINSLK